MSILSIGIGFLSSSLGYYFGYMIYIPTKYILILSDIFQYGKTIEISETWRTPLAILFLGIGLGLIFEQAILPRDKVLYPK